MNFWLVVLIIAIVLVGLDKAITYANVKQVIKHNPNINDPTSIEKNPIARWSFQKFGLLGGTTIYFFFSILTFMIAVWLLQKPITLFSKTNVLGISLYIVMIAYGFVIMNNVYFFLRYSKII